MKRPFLPILLAVTAVAYLPAWHGGILWDDDKHLTKAALRSVDGLWRIWFEPGATQQYYPLVHSAFWVMHRLWGDATTGYHLVNIALHALSAFLVARILRRLSIPGAELAAVIFALHPVHVESVAWMTELKNTLSGALYLGAMLMYLRFDRDRHRRSYAASLMLFVLALLSKTVTATLPAALLVVFWWMRGKISWTRDVRPLIAFFVVGIAAGLSTVWVERTLIGAKGGEFELTAIERVLIAGRAIWFYLAKLAWPADLVFIYPRWEIDAGEWWQYLFPLGVAAAVAFWMVRHRTRAPLAAFLLFGGTLFPVLGFFNVYPFRFSFVADHFVYLASVPIIALGSAALTRALAGSRGVGGPGGREHLAVVIALGAVLGTLTYAQSRQYRDAETLYRTTIARNPSAWMAHVNLGILELDAHPDEAAASFREALRIRPDNAEAHSNLGIVLHRRGDVHRAVAEYREALRIDPRLAQAHANLCSALNLLDRPEDAARSCAEALRLHYDYPEAHYNLGVAAQALGRPEAETHFREALRLKPDLADAHNNLGALYVLMARHQDAVFHFSEAVRIRPDYADAHFNLANLLQTLGRLEEAVASYRAAIAQRPADAAAYNNLGVALERLGKRSDAAEAFRQALRFNPASTQARDNLARVTGR